MILAKKCLYTPAFFSWRVRDVQGSRIRSLSDIQRSACSWGGLRVSATALLLRKHVIYISSHRVSILASVGFEMAWAWRICWSWLVTGVALGTAAARVARTIEVRIMAAVEWRLSKKSEMDGKGFPSRDLQLPMGGGDDGGDDTRRRSSLQSWAWQENRKSFDL